jgi:hypothetical protein
MHGKNGTEMSKGQQLFGNQKHCIVMITHVLMKQGMDPMATPKHKME